MMRIAVVNPNRDRLGGIETYLEFIVAALVNKGCSVAFLSEETLHQESAPIPIPANVPTWSVREIGLETTLATLREWTPDVVYAHGELEPELMRRLPEVAPAVFYAHGYYGTCITGAKSFTFPVARPCTRVFGLSCFLHYYPHRCGGLNPITMWRDYHTQSERSALLRTYSTLLTPSEYIRDEYLRHGFSPNAVHVLPCPVGRSEYQPNGPSLERTKEPPYRVLFIGRMTRLKGGELLLDAVRRAAQVLERPLHLALAGDGPARPVWERKAGSIRAKHLNFHFEFLGWLGKQDLEKVCSTSDLLVVPSLWPEPSGLVGREIGRYAVPQAAFAVGGIPEWLHDGVNGHLAPGDPPTAAGLAVAIIKCLEDSVRYESLRRGAVRIARQFSEERHLRLLLRVFEKVSAAHSKARATSDASSEAAETEGTPRTDQTPHLLLE